MTKKIGVDLGGTNLRVALIQNNKVLKYLKKSTPKNGKELFNLLCVLIKSLDSKDVKGIGVASPGPLKDGVIKNPPNLPLKNFNLKAELRKKFKKKVEINNDANCVALAESKIGCKKKNFIVLTLGTGIGGGIVINGEIYRGNGYAGELGHIILEDGDYFEDLWQNARNMTKKHMGEDLLIKDLLKINNKKCKMILNTTAVVLGKGIGSLINVFDPDIVILKGGLRETGSKFLNMVKKEVKNYQLIPRKIDIEWSKLSHPGTLGASLLV
jgi:glucokinase